MNNISALKTLGKKSTKDEIISALSLRQPLTAKEIYNTLNREHGNVASYQAVHKTILNLVDENVIEKNEKQYQLNKEWVKEIANFGKNLEHKYQEILKKIDDNGSVMLTFSSYIEFGRFLVNEFFTNFPNPENKSCPCIWNHAYPLAGVSKEEHDNFKKIFVRTEHTNICAQSTFLDKMTSDYLDKLGKKGVLNARTSAKNDVFITGDYVMTVYLDLEWERELDQIYKKVKSEKDLNMQELFELGSKKADFKVAIVKNAELAEALRVEGEKQFINNKSILKYTSFK